MLVLVLVVIMAVVVVLLVLVLAMVLLRVLLFCFFLYFLLLFQFTKSMCALRSCTHATATANTSTLPNLAVVIFSRGFS